MKTAIDLGIKPEDNKSNVCCPEPSKVKEPSYPEFTFRDGNVDKFKEAVGNVGMDEEIVATVRLRVKGMRHDQYGKSIDVCVISMEDVEVEGKAEDETEDGEEDYSKGPHKNPAVNRLKKKPAPAEDPEDEPSIKA